MVEYVCLACGARFRFLSDAVDHVFAAHPEKAGERPGRYWEAYDQLKSARLLRMIKFKKA
jgi:hypothetical protein